MVDKETMAKEATDMRDPAFQDLYVPRKKGDSTNTAGITQGPGPGPEKTRPTTDLKSFVSGVLGKYRHPILAELNVELNTPVVEQPNTRFRMTDSQFKDYA